jgi:hypothetical protein
MSGKRKILFVFDNVDHYVDLEQNKLSGNAGGFLEAYLNFPTNSRLIFTCRPDIQYQDENVMGQIDPALICYRKSALVLQKSQRPHAENQAFIRTWVGELLIMKGEFCSAKAFLEAAEQKWKPVSPVRESAVRQTLTEIEFQTRDCPPMGVSDAERYVVAWINDRQKYFVGQGHSV